MKVRILVVLFFTLLGILAGEFTGTVIIATGVLLSILWKRKVQ